MNIMNISISEIVGVVRDAGVLGILIVIIYGGSKQWWVWGWQYLETLKELNMWKEMAISGLLMAQKSVETNEKVVGNGAFQTKRDKTE